jgi:hypothetical protein
LVEARSPGQLAKRAIRIDLESRIPAGREPRTTFRVPDSIDEFKEAKMERGILLWLLGVPIPVIILLWLFFGR